jgi:mannosyltransferase OCH1-like enzyme
MATVIVPRDTVELDNILIPWVKQELVEINISEPGRVLFPRIIHQIWFDFSDDQSNPEIKDDWQATPSHWQKHHSGWMYILWNKTLALEFITRFEPHFLETYLNYEYPIQQCDAIRYCFLKRYGGLYVDLDIYPKEDISPYITAYSEVYLLPETSINMSGRFSNNFMISQPGSDLWDRVISEMITVEPPFTFLSMIVVFHTTGPHMLTKVVAEWGHGVFQLPIVLFNPLNARDKDEGITTTDRAVLIHLQGRSWFNPYDEGLYFLYTNWIKITLISVLIIICLLWYFGYRFRWYRKQFELCSATKK